MWTSTLNGRMNVHVPCQFPTLKGGKTVFTSCHDHNFKHLRVFQINVTRLAAHLHKTTFTLAIVKCIYVQLRIM